MDEIIDSPSQDERPKARHGCVTAWLIFMIVVNSIVAVMYLFNGSAMMAALPDVNISPSIIMVLGFVGILNVIFAIMLWKWKKLGFWGFIASSLVSFGINMNIGLGIAQSLFGLIGVGLLFAVLQIKQDQVSAWDNME
ncbi:MAG: hypothetical protein ACR2MX_05425 [Cyclobacteriaceae bacterium]